MLIKSEVTVKLKINRDGVIKINFNKLLIVFSSFAAAYFALSDSPIGSIGISVSIQCLMLVFLNAALLFNLIRKEMRLRLLAVVFLLMTFFIFRNSYFPAYTHYLQCYLLSFLICLNACKWSENWIKYFLNILRIGYWFYAIITVLSYISSSFYFNFVLPFFKGSDTYAGLLRTYRMGFMPGFTAHYSINGMYLVVGMMIAATFCIASNFKKYRMETLFFAFSLLLTGKRAHILFGVVACFLMFCIIKLPENAKGVLKILGIIFAGLIAFVILVNTVPALQNFMTRFDKSAGDDGAMLNRFGFWKLAITLFSNNPFSGIGWGQFRVYALKKFDKDAYTHNVYLELLCENGILGAILFYSFFIVSYIITIRLLYKFAKEKLRDTDRMKYVMFSFAMQTFFLLYCFTGNPIIDRIMYIPYFISCGITYYYHRMMKENIGGVFAPDIIKWTCHRD